MMNLLYVLHLIYMNQRLTINACLICHFMIVMSDLPVMLFSLNVNKHIFECLRIL